MNYVYPPGIVAHDPRHGTIAFHHKYGCRCEACVQAHNAYQRERRSRARLPKVDPRHGTVNGYINFSCRCEACSAAGSEWNATQYRARQTARLAGGQS